MSRLRATRYHETTFAVGWSKQSITLVKDALGDKRVAEDVTKDINPKPHERLEPSVLRCRASQTGTSGAQINIAVNGKLLSTLRWHAFETDVKKVNIAFHPRRGNNVIDFEYISSDWAIGSQAATISHLETDITISSIDQAKPPKGLEVGPTVVESTGEIIQKKANAFTKSATNLIVLGLILVIGYKVWRALK